MSKLSAIIKSEIRLNGPISLARYMELCLVHPEHGYYMTRDPFGVQGDFTTAPEISQVFGEIIAAFLIDGWMKLGAPDPIHLVELGPGRGTLMSDILRVGDRVEQFKKAAQIHLVETSPVLKKQQTEALRNRGVRWHNDLQTLPKDAPFILLGNEFLDALSVHQLILTDQGWQEIKVGLDERDDLKFGQQEAEPYLIKKLQDEKQSYKIGEVVEISPAHTI